MELKDFIKSRQTNRTNIMEGRVKEELKSLLGKEITIKNFDFLPSDNGEYVVFTIEEDEGCFYFGSTVITQELKTLTENGFKEEIKQKGLKVILEEKRAKNSSRTYIAVNYV